MNDIKEKNSQYELNAKDILKRIYGPQISLGLKNNFSPNKFNNVTNDPYKKSKPIGGLWCSPFIDRGGYISSWHKCAALYLDDKTYNKKYESYEQFENVTIFEFKKLTRAFIVNSKDDFKRLTNTYGEKQVLSKNYTNKYINFERLSKDYDILYVTPKGLLDNLLDEYNLSAWDVSSILVMNKECIDLNSIRYRKLSEFMDKRLENKTFFEDIKILCLKGPLYTDSLF